MNQAPAQPPERLVTAKRAEEDAAELALRPQTIDDSSARSRSART